MTTTDDEKATILHALRCWVQQRPGLEFGNYGDVKLYRQEMRSITRDRHDAEQLLRAVELSGLAAEGLKAGFHAYSGRLTVKVGGSGSAESPYTATLSYCTGQYWPTEYRKAVCAVCASALWDYYREDYAQTAKNGESPGDAIRRNFRRVYGSHLQRRWFD